MMVKQTPNPNEHTGPSRYRLTGHRMSGKPTVNYPSRYRHENDNKVPQGGNTIETIQADSRRERTNQGRNEKRKEGEMRAAASEVADVTNETDLTQRPKEKSAGAHLRQSTEWPGTGYEVANLTNDSNLSPMTRCRYIKRPYHPSEYRQKSLIPTTFNMHSMWKVHGLDDTTNRKTGAKGVRFPSNNTI